MKNVFLMAIIVVCGMCLHGCGGQKAGEQTASEKQEALSVDYVLEHADSLVGQTIEIEGVCSHLCKHGGKKAFLLGKDEHAMFRAEAVGIDSFPTFAIQKVLRIKGKMIEDRIDEAAVQQMEADFKKVIEVHGENQEVGCDAEKVAQGQAEINSFAARMQDYRDKIAARQAKEGKAYLSFYHLDADSYEVQSDSVR